jgi:hypothetical protein
MVQVKWRKAALKDLNIAKSINVITKSTEIDGIIISLR